MFHPNSLSNTIPAKFPKTFYLPRLESQNGVFIKSFCLNCIQLIKLNQESFEERKPSCLMLAQAWVVNSGQLVRSN